MCGSNIQYMQAYEEMVKVMRFIFEKYCKERTHMRVSLYCLKALKDENTERVTM